jgi:hypothetical protein
MITHPDLVPSLGNVVTAGEQAKAADKPRKPLPSLGDAGTTTEGPGPA